MKQKLITTTILLLLLTACRKEWEENPAAAPAGTFSLQEIEAGYEAIPGITPGWNSAEFRPTKTGGYWLVPVQGNLSFQHVKQGYRELMFFKDSAGMITTRLLNIIPDAQYLLRKRKISPVDFTGRVFILDRAKELLSGQIYSNGKLVGAIKPGDNPSGSLRTEYVAPIESCQWVQSYYLDSEENVVIYAEQICSTTYVDDGGGGATGVADDGTGGSTSGGGSGSTTSGSSAALSVSNLPGETKSGINPAAFIKCFGNIPDQGATMQVTLYVQEPFPGTTFNLGPNSVGHVAIGLTKSNGSQRITQVVGYYPNATGLDKMHASSKVVDNGGDLEYNVSISYSVNAGAFANISEYIANAPGVYDLTSFNCTNFVYQACLSGGITIPDPVNTVGLGGPDGIETAMTPAGLGNSIEKLKGQPNVNTNGGTTPISKGACQ